MVSPQSDDEQFNFYLKFAKPLVLNLSDTNDRIKAAAWIRKLKEEVNNAALRTDYLKLLLFVLQRRKLIGPFAVVPDSASPLQPFPEEINLQDVAKNFVEIDKKLLKEAIEKGGFGEWPPYNVACSSDLKEYAASQEIPNFGVHVYFAISKDPIHNWEQKNKAIFPIGEKIETSNDFGLSTNISPNISSFVPQEQKSPKKNEGGDGSTNRKDTLPPPSNFFDVEDGITPNWGSNLMKVNDDVLEEDFNEEDFDFNVSNGDMLDLNDEDIDLDEVEGISDLEDSFYLEGDKLKSPVCSPCSSQAPSMPSKTSPVSSVNLPSPAPSLPYKSPAVPTVNLPSPAPSLPYRTPPKPGSPDDSLFDFCNMHNADMLDYMDQSMNLIEDEDIFFDDVDMYLQSDRLQSSSTNEPCEPCGSLSPRNQTPYSTVTQGHSQPSPAPSLPYRTPPISTANLPSSPSPNTPYRTPPKPGTPYDLKYGSPNESDMIDYFNESMDLVEDISFGDAAMYLQTDRLVTPSSKPQSHQPCGSTFQSPAQSSPYRSPPMTRTQTPTQMQPQPCHPCQSPQYRPTLERSEEEELKRLEREIFNEIQTQDFDRDQTPNKKRQLETSGECYGGDSFIAPECRDFRWLQDVPPGSGLPEDIEQNPDLWESFGWWTDNPDEIFEYIPPSPRVCGSPDPYAKERERWADVPATPPIFSRDPQIQTGPGAQRIYAIEEFGMESFEEPVWTCADQYMRYMPESPYQDPRDVNRQTLDMAQYNRCSEINNQLFEMQDGTEPDYYFTEEQPPIDDLEVSFNTEDYQKMSCAQAVFEAIQHGPQRIGAPPSPPTPPPEDQIQYDEAMFDVEFLSKTPPKFVFEPQFFSTPPAYHPNPRLNAADFDETISKYIEDEMKIIESSIPVTTPERSHSPKRKKRFIGNETLPDFEDVVLDNENIVSSPELKTPPRYCVIPQREINWNTEIGEPRKISPLQPAYLGIPDDERQAKGAKRRKELAAMYREQFASPPMPLSPEAPDHLIDEPIPCGLGSPIPPKKLPPPGWDWQSPPTSQKSCYVPRVIKTPTGLTPPKKMPADVTIFHESPPNEIYSPPPSPSVAVGALQFSPPARFDYPPSPVRSPGGRPIFADWHPAVAANDIDIQYEDLIAEEYPDLYTSPVRAKSPDTLKDLESKTINLSPASKKNFYDAEIEALENEVFKSPSASCGSSCVQSSGSRVQSPGSPHTPEYERSVWKENLKLHDPDEYWKRQWVVRPKPGKAKAIKRFTVGSRLGTIPDDEESSLPAEPTLANIEAKINALRRAEEEAMRKTRQLDANRQLMQDIADLTKITYRQPPKYPGVDQSYVERTNREMKDAEAMCQRKYIKERVRQRIQSQFTSPPRPCISPIVHPLDEPLPEEADLPPALLPPSGWTWETPPRYKMSNYKPCEKRTPTGMESPEKMSEDVTMYYESPPYELLSPTSPCAATSALQYTPTCGFNIPSSPIRSPGGRPITDSWQLDNIIDEIDLDKVYPAQFEDIYDEEIPEMYMSPPKVCGIDKIRQEINVNFPNSPYNQYNATSKMPKRPLSPVTPEREKQVWKEKLKLHELHDYSKKQWTVRPKPGKTKKVKRFTSRPALHTIPDEREQSSPEVQPCIHEEAIHYSAEQRAEIAAINRTLKATEEVLKDILDLPQVQTFHPPGRRRYIICDPSDDLESLLQQSREIDEIEYSCAKAMLKQEIKQRVEHQFASPPRVHSPEPEIHPFDEPLPEELELPTALLPPSGWSWQTPPKFKLPEYKPRDKYSPKISSSDKPFSEDVTMFYESPPREFLSPTSPCNANTSPQDNSPLPTSPLTHGVSDDKYLENILTAGCECIDQEENPELYISPTKDKSPKQIQQEESTLTNQASTISLEDQIAALECECFGEIITSPARKKSDNLSCKRAAPTTSNIQHSPETPEFKRKLWKDSLKCHHFDKEEQYPKQLWVIQPKPCKKVKIPRHVRKPKLETISDVEEPNTSKVNREDIIKAEKRMQESRRIYEEAQKQAMLDILKLEALTQSNMAKKSPCYQGFSEEGKAKLKEDIARRVREQFSSPPQNIQQPEPITHPFDEELPSDLPSALLPPSGWGWQTPPRLQHKPFASRRIVSPTGVSPPQQFDPESLLYESPPQLSPEEDLEDTCLPCSPFEASRRTPLQSPKDRLMQTRTESPMQSSKKTTTSPPALPPFSPIKSALNKHSTLSDSCSVPFENDRAQIYPNQMQDIEQEFPPEEFSGLPSPPPSNIPEPMTDEEYSLIIDAEIRDVDIIMKSMENRNVSPGTPPTPKYARRIWQQELALRLPLQLPNRMWVVKPTPGKSYKVAKSKVPGLSPVKEKYLEWSPEVYQSPVRSPSPSPRVTTPSREPQMPPKNWTWKTPSPKTLKTTGQKLIEQGVIPFSTPPGELHSSPNIFNETPPHIPQSPPDTSPIDVCSPCSGASPPQLTPEFYFSPPESESPILSPDISPYRSPLRSPGGRPIIPEWAQNNDDDFYFSEILPCQHELVDEEPPPEEMYAAALPPSPPPLPATPKPYFHQISLTPRTRPKPDINMFSPEGSPIRSPDIAYQSQMSPCHPCGTQPMRRGQTPESAKRPCEPLVEAVRFEPKRPTPKPSPPAEYQTPNMAQFRGPRRRRQINREAPRRRLIFEEDTCMEDDVEEIHNLQRAMEECIPCDALRDVEAESPPKDANISVLTDVDYEPEEFNLFEDENTEEYNVRLPFEGHRHHYSTEDGSPIPVTDEIPEDERDFRWMPYNSNCQSTPKR